MKTVHFWNSLIRLFSGITLPRCTMWVTWWLLGQVWPHSTFIFPTVSPCGVTTGLRKIFCISKTVTQLRVCEFKKSDVKFMGKNISNSAGTKSFGIVTEALCSIPGYPRTLVFCHREFHGDCHWSSASRSPGCTVGCHQGRLWQCCIPLVWWHWWWSGWRAVPAPCSPLLWAVTGVAQPSQQSSHCPHLAACC